MRRERNAIEELAALLEGRVPAGDTGAPVRRLATLATTVSEHTTVPSMDATARARVRTDVVGAATGSPSPLDRLRDAVDARTARLRYSLRAAVAAGTASSMLATAGMAAASQAALPGDLLYPVKQGTESVRLWLADGLPETGRLHLAFARERLEEVEDGVERLDADRVVTTLDDMDHESVLGANDLLTAYDGTGDGDHLATLRAFTAQQTDRLSTVAPLLPAEARPSVEQSLEVLRRIDVQVATVADTCTACEDGSAVAASSPLAPDRPRVTLPGQGPAVSTGGCGCVARTEPSPPREPSSAPAPPREPAPQPEPEPEPDEQPEPDRDHIPELPEPLDPIGDHVDDLIDDLEDAVVPPDPSASDAPLDGPVTDPVEELLEDVVGTLDGVVDGVGGTAVPAPAAGTPSPAGELLP